MIPTRPEYSFLLLGEGMTMLLLLCGDSVLRLMVPLVAEAFKEHERQNIILVVLPCSLPPEDVRRAPEMCLELLLGEFLH